MSLAVERWHLLTGEYPPHPGGVADHTAQLAEALARAGAEVHVWTSGQGGDDHEPFGVTVHRTAGVWARGDLARLGAALDAFPSPRRLLVQYTPVAWGFKGLNLGFCRWLVERGQRDDVRVLFHEVCYPWRLFDKPTRWLLAAGQRWMARTAQRAGKTHYVAIPHWETRLRAAGVGLPGPREFVWLPVPSNIPEARDPSAVAALRGRIAPEGQTVVGSFGTYGDLVGGMLARVLPRLLSARPDRVGLLIGRGSARFAARLIQRVPELSGRLVAADGLDPSGVSTHLQACDLLVQPFHEGVTSRRGSVMAGLAHGLAIATTVGPLSESVWAETGCVALAPAGESAALVETAEALLTVGPDARRRLGAEARATYDRLFRIERVVETLTLTREPAEARP